MTRIFVETRIFTRQAAIALPAGSLRALQLALLERPRAGAVIPGLRGIRKLRWGGIGRGKRGGVRVLYFLDEAARRIYLLLVYEKGVQDRVTPDQRAVLLRVLDALQGSCEERKCKKNSSLT